MQLTCTNGDNDNGNTAMINATATGDSGPFAYRWDVSPVQIAPGNPRLAIGLKAHLWYFIQIEDQFGCIQQDSIYTDAITILWWRLKQILTQPIFKILSLIFLLLTSRPTALRLQIISGNLAMKVPVLIC